VAGAARPTGRIEHVAGVIVTHGVLVRWSSVPRLPDWPSNGPANEFEEEAPDSAVVLAPQRCHRLCLVFVGDDDAPWCAPHSATHADNCIAKGRVFSRDATFVAFPAAR
jgi:hypothetical protein